MYPACNPMSMRPAHNPAPSLQPHVSQAHHDVFFVDWEQPRGQQADEKLPNQVSVWRSVFAANEWVKLQTSRAVYVEFNLLFLLFLLRGMDQARYWYTYCHGSCGATPRHLRLHLRLRLPSHALSRTATLVSTHTKPHSTYYGAGAVRHRDPQRDRISRHHAQPAAALRALLLHAARHVTLPVALPLGDLGPLRRGPRVAGAHCVPCYYAHATRYTRYTRD